MKTSLGQEGIAKIIKEKMNGNNMILLPNEYPYDALMPNNGSLKHFCLWVDNENLLTMESISKTIEEKFPAAPFFVFVHDGQLNSVKLIPHAHIIVALKV